MVSSTLFSADNEPLKCELEDDMIVINDDLRISFQRTIHVPDNLQISSLPPDLGSFPLKPVSKYADKLGMAMASKGGVFFPMYQSEAMWIDFTCSGSQDYMIKIYVGGANVISGEHAAEDAGTKLRRQQKMASQRGSDTAASSLQEYIVVPDQQWLDGIADSNGTVRQFVAMPFGSGHSIESQITGKDAAGGIQFEIVPFKPSLTTSFDPSSSFEPVGYTEGKHCIFVKTLTGRTIELHAHEDDSIEVIKCRVKDKEGIPNNLQRLNFAGKLLQDDRTLACYGVLRESMPHLVLSLRGGGPPVHEMSIAAGGRVHQVITEDCFDDEWLPGRTTVFNTQILKSTAHRAITGVDPPSRPLTAKDYDANDMPFFEMYEELSGICGEFSMVKSIAEIEQSEEPQVEPRVVPVFPAVGMCNPNGPLRPFRTVRDLEKEYSGYHVARF